MWVNTYASLRVVRFELNEKQTNMQLDFFFFPSRDSAQHQKTVSEVTVKPMTHLK